MTSSFRILFLVTSIILITACGSESDHELKILGNWQSSTSTTESYLSFSTSETVGYKKHPDNECFIIERETLLSLTPSSFSVKSTQNPELTLDLLWSITSETLTIKSPSIQDDLLYSRTEKNLADLGVCSDTSEESPADDTPKEAQSFDIVGSWLSDSGMYLLISESKIITAIYHNNFECHSTVDVAISSLTDSSFIINNNNHTLEYTISEETLTIPETSESFTSTDFIETSIVSCEDPTATGNISISIEFSHLPESISIKHDVDLNNPWIYELSIMFDIDGSEDFSVGDLSFTADHVQEVNSDEEYIALQDIPSAIYYIYEAQKHENGNLRSWSQNTISVPAITVDTQTNTITFFTPRREHIALATITSETNLKVYATYQDTNADQQSDTYPTAGYTHAEDTSDLTDEQSDVSGNYSTDTIVDIISISVEITE